MIEFTFPKANYHYTFADTLERTQRFGIDKCLQFFEIGKCPNLDSNVYLRSITKVYLILMYIHEFPQY